MRLRLKPHRDQKDGGGADPNLAAVNDRLDQLTHQIARIAEAKSEPRDGSLGRDRVADALARIDRRLDQMFHETPAEAGRRNRPAQPPMTSLQAPMLHWPSPVREPAADLTAVEQQLQQINSQITQPQQPYGSGLTALRNDLSEIARTLHKAMPRRAIEALEADVRTFAEKLDRSRHAGADGGLLGKLEHSLEQIRDALRDMMPAESFVGFDEAVRALSHKVDQIAADAQGSQGGQDPAALQQLEQAVLLLRGAVANVASDNILAQLGEEVRTLAGQVERTAIGTTAEPFGKLEDRIAAPMEHGRVSPGLSERLDQTQLSQSDKLALETLEDSIAKLCEKLDASDARMRHLDAIERGLADLLVYLEENRGSRGPRATAMAAPPAPPGPAPSHPNLTPEAREVPQPPPAARPMPRSLQHGPIEPNLPPDTPLEPGSRMFRSKPGSTAARIAASEAALGHARPAPSEHGGKSAVLAAARNAAKAAYLDTPVNVPPMLRGRFGAWLRWPFRRRPKQFEPVTHQPIPAPSYAMPAAANDDVSALPATRGRRAARFVKNLLVAASVAIIMVGAAETAFDLIWPDSEPAKSPPSAPALPLEPAPPPANVPRPAPSPLPLSPAPTSPDTTYSIDPPSSSFFDPSTALPPSIQHPDATGSISQSPAPPRPQPPATNPDVEASLDPLLAGLGPELRVAVAGKNPAAEYELGVRCAEGRGVPQNMPEAIRWFGRSANAGFVPALFRLGSLYERGEGTKKNLQAARRYYLSAAGKGHAKAMHNLAVLYAEGIDGKPDYKVAAQWFRKAANHGVSDSQYNLAILYARGIGVETNLVESYRWFALAAAHGDAEAAKKRDEVAARLDPPGLTAAKLAAQTFVPEREPEEATSLRIPPGGWDRTPAAPSKPQRREPASTAR